ncbi:MAG: sigma-70 family RNA polymerase sigma factor [Bdellovibrionales bacterium]|nr:sigma-70 family RNA polymerase sigma factor [Bdellovibrionales bacterium]
MSSTEEHVDSETVEALVEQHIAYAKSLAQRFYLSRQHVGIELDDYIGAALLGLCDAARRYDPKKNDNFRTFSFFRIRGSMYDLMRRGGGVSREYYSELLRKSGDRPEGEGKKRLGFGLANDPKALRQLAVVIEQFGMCVHHSSGTDEVDLSYADCQTPEEQVSRRTFSRDIGRIIEALPERERAIIRRRYFEAQTFEEMRDIFDGVSKSWISRLHNRGLERLRVQLEAQYGKALLQEQGYVQ